MPPPLPNRVDDATSTCPSCLQGVEYCPAADTWQPGHLFVRKERRYLIVFGSSADSKHMNFKRIKHHCE